MQQRSHEKRLYFLRLLNFWGHNSVENWSIKILIKIQLYSFLKKKNQAKGSGGKVLKFQVHKGH